MVIAIWHPLVTAHVVVFALFLVASSATYTPDYAVYHNLSRIYAHVAELAESFPAYLRVDHSFKSRNGLSQLLVRLSNFSGSSYAGPHLQSFKVKVLLWYGEHSCHLFPVESALYLLAHVLQGLGQPGHSVDGSFSRALLSKVDLHVVLLANPDGRNHLEQTGNHCWCGTSIGTSLSAVFHSGMDLNRAEPECQVLLNLTRTQTFDSFVSFHSGARAIYVASSDASPNRGNAAVELAKKIAQATQGRFTHGQASETPKFPSDEAAINFMARVRKIPVSLAVNLWGDGLTSMGKECFSHFNPKSHLLEESLESLLPLYHNLFNHLIQWKEKEVQFAFSIQDDGPSLVLCLVVLGAAVGMTMLFACQNRLPDMMRFHPRRRVISLKSLSSTLHVS